MQKPCTILLVTIYIRNISQLKNKEGSFKKVTHKNEVKNINLLIRF